MMPRVDKRAAGKRLQPPHAAEAIGGSVQDWLADLRSPDWEKRSLAAFMLAGDKGNRTDVIGALRTRLADSNDEVAEFAASALASHRDESSFDAILQRLPSGAPVDRWDSAWAIAQLARGENRRRRAIASLMSYHLRARGRSREHASLLLARLHARALPQKRKK